VPPLSFTFLPDPEGVKTLILEEADRLKAARLPQARRTIRAQVEASTQPGIHAHVPKPVAPPTAVGLDQARPGAIARAYGGTVGRLFWIERKAEDEVTWRKHPLRLVLKVAPPTLIALVLILIRAGATGRLAEAQVATCEARLRRVEAHWTLLEIDAEIIERARRPFPLQGCCSLRTPSGHFESASRRDAADPGTCVRGR
jgi:hypothetical protein